MPADDDDELVARPRPSGRQRPASRRAAKVDPDSGSDDWGAAVRNPAPTSQRAPRAPGADDDSGERGAAARARPASRRAPKVEPRGERAGGEKPAQPLAPLPPELAPFARRGGAPGQPPSLREGPGGASAAVPRRRSGLDRARLERLLEINKAINTELDLGRLLDMIMDAAVDLSGARHGFLVLGDKGEVQVVRARNVDGRVITTPEAAISRHLIREAIDRRETVVTAKASSERQAYASATGLDLKSVMVSPLLARGHVLGAIYVDEPERVGVFQPEDIRTLEAFCDQVAIALTNARRVADLQDEMESQRARLSRVEAEVRRRDEEEVRRFGNLITRTPKMRRVFDLLQRVAETAFPVIIQGESGTGKELLAKAIHYSSPRRAAPFVSVNCAALTETLLDSELFGYQAGAFTGAVRDHKGLFEQADRGTLFLDEIEEMSAAMQSKLLRVLQEGEVRRIGGKGTVKVDVRVLAATNRDMQEMVERGAFRRDLYYRLNVIPVLIPPLRERQEDLPALVADLLQRMAEPGRPSPAIEDEALDALARHAWPGNVRELENELKRLQALGVDRVRLADLSSHIARAPARPSAGAGAQDGEAAGGDAGWRPPTLNIRELERLTIERALEQAGGNKTHAARLLGVSRRGLLKKLERYRGAAPDEADADAEEADDDER